MLEKPHRTHPSSARFVGQGLGDSLAAAVTPAAVTNAFYHLQTQDNFQRDYFFIQLTCAQRLALLACGRDADSLDRRKKLRDAENA